VSKKENDYKNKFSAPKGEIHCMNCVHMKRATKAHKMLILDGNRVIAEGPASRTPYCELAEVTAREILEWTDFQTQAQKCLKERRFQFRPGREPEKEVNRDG